MRTTLAAPTAPSRRSEPVGVSTRLAGAAAIIGGAFWLAKAIAATWLPAGAAAAPADAPWREHVTAALFRTGPLLLGLALLSLHARLGNRGHRGRGLGVAGAAAAWVA